MPLLDLIKLKKFRFMWIFAVIWLSHASPCPAVSPAQIIRVGIFENKPLVFQDEFGRPQGLYVDLLERIARQHNWQLEFMYDTWANCLEGLTENKIELLTSIAYTKQRDLRMDFSKETVIILWGTVYVAADSEIETFFDLHNRKAAVMKGGIFGRKFKQLCDDFDINCTLVQTRSQHESLGLLTAGKVESAVFNNAFKGVLDTSGAIRKTSLAFSPLKTLFAAPEGRHHDTLAAIDSTLRDMKRDKASLYYESLKKWFSVMEVPRRFIPKWLTYTFTVVCVILVCSLVGTTFFLVLFKKQKAADQALRNSEARLAALSDASFEAIFLSEKGMCQDQNKTAERIFGYSRTDAVGRPGTDWIAPEDRERVQRHMLSGYDKPYEVTAIRKDGTTFPCEIQGRMLDGRNQGIRVTALRDITERVKAQEALRESEQKFRTMMESMSDAAYITAKDCRILYMNPRMISRLGRDATGELCHKAIYEFDENCPWCAMDQILQGEYVNYEMVNPNDQHVYSVTNSPIVHSQGRIEKLTVFRDITESKANEAQLREARKMESIGTLAGGIAHDFNNILYMIVGNAELAQEEIPGWNPVYANLEEIKAAGLRAAGIVKQLLNFSRKTDQELKTVDAIPLVREALKFLRTTIPANIEVRTQLPYAAVTILADPVQINQVLMNLCANAAQAMEEAGGILSVMAEMVDLDSFEVERYPDLTPGKHLCLTISDTGPGIVSGIIDRIFDPYFTTREVGKGSGLGLAVVLGIVKNHGGAISVASQPGEGAVFTLLLPRFGEKPIMALDIDGDLPGGRERIMLVDDEKIIVSMAAKTLGQLGYTVVAERNPARALRLFQSAPDDFDLLITDMTMPQMTGVQLFKKIKAVRADIPVILYTGHSSVINPEQAHRLGFAAYVRKPIVKRDFAAGIRKVLDAVQNESRG